MNYLITLAIGTAIGYLVGTYGSRYERSEDIQRLIDIDATQRKADGIKRTGDTMTEYQGHECGAGRPREVAR
jgi:hypothetical protein